MCVGRKGGSPRKGKIEKEEREVQVRSVRPQDSEGQGELESGKWAWG